MGNDAGRVRQHSVIGTITTTIFNGTLAAMVGSARTGVSGAGKMEKFQFRAA